jgi:uncharacterized delta-60 repeat protein
MQPKARSNPNFSRPLVGLLLFFGLAGFVEAAPGVVVSDISGRAYAMVIDSSGRIVTAGMPSVHLSGNGFAITRYNSDGSLDTTFGNGGVVITNLSVDRGVSVTAMAMDSLGRIVVVGSYYRFPESSRNSFISNSECLVARYNSNGSLDTTFGNGGIVITDISGGYDVVHAVVIDSLGRIVIAGSAGPLTGPGLPHSSMALARYDSNGLLDATFANGGIVTTDTATVDTGGRGSSIGGVAIDGAGRIVAVGSSNGAFMLARYNSHGSLDNTFGGDTGIVTIANIGGSGGWEGAATVAIDSLGRIVAGGEAAPHVGRTDFALARCNSDGSLDTSFGNGGTVTRHISAPNSGWDDSKAAGLVIDSLDGIVAVGVCPGDCGPFSFELARYNSDGSPDNTFGNRGLVITNPGGAFSNDSSQVIAIDSLGRIVVAGSAEDDFALARYNSDGSLDSTFGVPVPVPVVTGLRFDRSIVATGSSYLVNFSGDNLTDETFFDVRFTAPGSNDSVVVLNWQTGLAANHSVPAGTTSGIWNISGVRAHKIESDHNGNFVSVSAMITVVTR